MTMLCRTDLSIGLPRHLLWELLTDPAARRLWQPNVISANLISGYGGGKGCVICLEVSEGNTVRQVKEQVIRSRLQDTLSTIQNWPNHQLYNKFILSAETKDTTLLTLQKRFKGSIRFALLGKQLTRRQLETATTTELLGIKNLSTKLHNKMADPIS